MNSNGPWEVFDDQLPLLSATYGGGRARMVALGLRGGGLAVWSPGKHADAARDALKHWGDVRFLLAPNHFHNAGLAEWIKHAPGAVVVAHPDAHARLRKQVPSITAIAGLDDLSTALPDGARVFGPPMAKQGETWLAVEKGDLRALAVCDSIVNMPRVPWAFWALGFRARLMTNPLFKRLFLTDKTAYKEWLLTELATHPPNVFIPSHGDVLRGAGVADDLKRVTEIA